MTLYCRPILYQKSFLLTRQIWSRFTSVNVVNFVRGPNRPIRDIGLFGVDLSGADLSGAIFGRVDLSNSNLSGATLKWTAFGDIDLSQVKGLETVKHLGPSSIGIDTIYRSKGNIPEAFLRKAGVPESFLTNMRYLIDSMRPIDFYSCFISYSSKDQAFAERLYADLQSKGVRCWFAPEDMKTGDEIRVRIDEAIRIHTWSNER